MKFFLVSALFTIAAQAAPGVWEEMQNGTVNSQKGIVKNVQISGHEIIVKLETKDQLGNTVILQDKLCQERDERSEEMRATFLKSKFELLEEARKSKREIEIGSKSPWNSCINFVSLAG